MALKQHLTREVLKEKIGDINIFKHYFGDFDFSTSYNSVFRNDQRKSTGFYVSENGSVIYNDFGVGGSYDFVSFVMKLHNLTFYKAIRRIADDFGINEGSDVKPVAVIQPVKKIEAKPKALYTVIARPFSKQDLKWWLAYGITLKELKANNVFSVASVTIKDFTIHTQTNEIKFAYLFKDEDGNGYFKIYSPYSEQWKWSNNAPLNLPFGLDSLACTGDTLIITKSVKDCLVLRKFFPECIGLQNESASALKKSTVKALQKCYKNIYVWFDLDRAGLKAANYYKKTYGFEMITTNNKKLNVWKKLAKAKKSGVKDPSDFVKRYNIGNFEKYLKHINLIK